MRRDPYHLPHAKERELARVTEILFAEFADAMKDASSPKKKEGRILKVILFGSYARGTWVDAPQIAGGHLSDYDLLVVVNQQSLADFATCWDRAEDRILLETAIRTPVNFIVHTLDEVNSALAQGTSFFTDIIREGIALCDLRGTTPFIAPRPQTADEALAMAEKHFEDELARIGQALAGVRIFAEAHNLRDAVFFLHQGVERAYSCFLLEQTNYSPATQNIRLLCSSAEQIERDLIAVWSRATKPDRRLFTLLQSAYIESRYSVHYAITAEELAWLSGRAEILRALVERRLQGRIAQLRKDAAAGASLSSVHG